ncbi:MAG: metal-dependent hydrolase [Pseudomonadales bacterium]|nr:metal-dependent hydrolase [Pseudomonadales bacterium]
MNNRVEINQAGATPSSLDRYAATPENHTLVPRLAKFEFDSSIPRFWQGEVFATRMFDAMQLAFPDGERMFIHSVRNYADKVTDPILKEQVKQFIFQEAQHGLAHTQFTETLTKQGLKVNGVVKLIKKGMLFFQDKAPHKYQLASTVAAEHLTASLGEFMLSSSEDNLLTNADPKMKAFYMWHGIEEVEHKAVAFDVYEQVAGGGYFTRSLALSLMYPMAIVPLMVGTMAMMHADGELNLKEMRKGFTAMFGKNGIWRKTFPSVMSFYSPTFHPWKTGYPNGFHEWKKVYEETDGDMDAAMEAAELVVAG